MDYVVYILYSQKRSRYYVGQTQNIKKRIEKHNKGLVKSTKTGGPWEVITIIKVSNRSKAVLLEKRIKKRGAERFLNDNPFGV